MKKIAYLVIVLFNCTSDTTFASAKEEQSKTSEQIAMKGLKRQNKTDVYLYIPNKKNFQNQLADMPATKIPFTTSRVEIPFTEEGFCDETDDRTTSNFNQLKAFMFSDIELFKDMIAVEKHCHAFKSDHTPHAPRTFFHSKLIQAPTKKGFPEDELLSPLEIACNGAKRATHEENLKFIQFLIDEGADVNMQEGKILLQIVNRFNAQHFANQLWFPKELPQKADIMNILLQSKIDLNKMGYGQTPLHCFVRSMPLQRHFTETNIYHEVDNTQANRQAYVANGRRIFNTDNSTNYKNLTYYTALETQARLIGKFLSAGANPYLHDNHAETVFEVAKATANKKGCDYIKEYLQETVSKLPNIPQLKRQAHVQVISEEYRPILLGNVHGKIQGKYIKSLQAQGKEEEIQAYRAECIAREETMPQLARLAHARELSRQSHAKFENSKNN